MTDLSDIASDRDDDTGRFANLIEPPSDPARQLTALGLAFDAHARDDRRAIRVVMWVGGVAVSAMLAASAAMLSAAWTAAEAQGRDRERIEQLVRDVARIEGRIERLDERISSRTRGEE